MFDDEWRAFRSFGRIRRNSGRILKQQSSKGYLSASVSRDGNAWRTGAHVLVCLAFHGEPPTPKHEVAHENGCRTDNRPNNLVWKTHRENQADMKRHGTLLFGDKHPKAKLTEREAREIISQLDSVPNRRLAAKYGVSRQTITAIRSGISWGWLATGGAIWPM